MNMKKIMITLAAGLLLTACSEDFLDLKNPNLLTTDTYWETNDDVMSAFAATYSLLRDVNGGYWGVRGVELTNGRGDDFFIRNDVKDLYQFSTFTNAPDNGVVTNIFNNFYRGIFRCNQILEKIGEVPMSEEERARLIAEAKFLRGLNYFHLVINFGDVPIRLKTPENQEEYYVPKSPAEEVWQQVFQDLSEAKAGLPLEYPAEWTGRATKGAATGYLGKAYLYHEDWDKAEAEFSALMQAPYQYDLMADYADNFTAERENNQESVFEIQVQDVGGTNPWDVGSSNEALGVTTAQEFAPAEVAGWFEAYPTDKIFNVFQEEKTVSGDFDKRMYVTLVWDYPGAMYYNRPFSEFKSEFGFKSRFRKYQNWHNDNEGRFISNINERALRFADVLLMYAEALAMQGRPQEAYAPVNRIRQRAGLAVLPAGYGTEQMMAEIRRQRMLEFCREGLRFYDLRRWGLLEQEIASSDKVGRQYLVVEKHAYLPIPQAELDNNPEMEQNPNW